MPRLPSLRRRRLAAALRNLREQAGYDIAQAAETTGFSRSKISRIESAAIAASGDSTHTLATTYGVDAPTVAELVALARQSSKRGWWHVYPDSVLGNLADRVELQEDARDTRQFTVDVIPGLLQTQDYAAAMIRAGVRELDEDTIADRVKVRTEFGRRALHDDSDLWFIIDEAALVRPVGGAAVMAAQLDSLARCAELPRVRLQVLSSEVTGHAALALPFLLATLDDGATYAYIELLTSVAYIDDASDLDVYRRAWELLQAAALDFGRSLELVRKHAAQHRSKTE